MIIEKRLYTLLLGLACTLTTFATPYCDVRKFSILDGLAANNISDIQQSDDKLMWFGTWNGLSYYDGYSFKTFRDIPTSRVLTTNRINFLRPNKFNDIWLVTYDDRPYKYDTHECCFKDICSKLNDMFKIDLRVKNIYCLKSGVTWLTTKGGDYAIRITYEKDRTPHYELIKAGTKGFKGGEIWFIRDDEQGREWILSKKGTYIYGSKFSTKIPFKWIRQVGNDYYLATVDGKLAIYDNKNHFSMMPLPAGITKINELKNTGYQLLIATNLGVVVYNTRSFKTTVVNVQSPNQPVAEVQKIYTDYKNLIWVFTNGQGVTTINPNTLETRWLYADQPNPSDRTESDKYFIMQDEHNTLWIVPNQGTFSYYDRKAGKLVPYLLRSNSSGNYRIPRITNFFIADQGLLWVRGLHDLTQINFKEHVYTLDQLDGTEDETRALLQDSQGRYWTGYEEGYIKVSDKYHQKIGYLSPSGQFIPNLAPFAPKPIRSLFEDSKGRIWIGTNDNGLYVWDKGNLQHYVFDASNPYSLPHNQVWDIDSDRKGRIWIATLGGGLVLAQESNGGFIFLSNRKGLNWFKGDEFQHLRHITCTSQGEILVGTTNGLVTFSDDIRSYGSIKFYKTTCNPNDTSSLAVNDVNYILQLSNGSVLVSSLGGTLQRIQDKELCKDNLKFSFVEWLNQEEGSVQSMIEDRQGNIWLVRGSSVDKYDPKKKKMTVFGPNDFDYNMSFTGARPIHDPATDAITLGTPAGALTYIPQQLSQTEFEPKIIFTTLHYMGESGNIPILHRDKLVIPANKRNLTISFAALDYTRKYQTKYLYRIEGITPEGEWVPLGGQNMIGFNRISHGKYILKIKATNTHGIWGRYIAELPIEVKPTFWESIWGRILIAFILITVSGGVLYTYNTRQRENLAHDMNRMKIKFFSDAAHKLRTPLTLIGGPVNEVLANESSLSSDSRKLLTIVQRNTREMLDMINKMLKFDNSNNFYTDGGLNETIKETDGKEIPNNQAIKGGIDDENAAAHLEEVAEEASEGFGRTFNDIALLVVEDNPDLRQFLYSILHVQYNVILAENGKEGLLKARQEMPDFILTDVTMPVMDGITMVHYIKQDSTIAHIPIVILSAKASVEDQLKGFEEGIDGYLTKPFSATYLKSRIEAVINQRRTLQQELLRKLQQAEGKDFMKTHHMMPDSKPKATEEKPTTAPQQGTQGDSAKNNEEESINNAFMAAQINDVTTEKIMKFITDHIADPDLKIDDIAQAIGMSRSVLYGKIKNAIGMTPVDFVRHIRIMRATEMLQQTDETLASIAYAVGFSDPKYFSKVFKKEMGVIPSEYRERTKQ